MEYEKSDTQFIYFIYSNPGYNIYGLYNILKISVLLIFCLITVEMATETSPQ